jgi:hypothetical protein
MQMKGGEKVTLHPGDTFYEDPEGIHLVGKNASDTKTREIPRLYGRGQRRTTSHSCERLTPTSPGLARE